MCLWMSLFSLGSPNYKHLCFITPKEVIHDLKDKHKKVIKHWWKEYHKPSQTIERIKSFDKAHYGKNWIRDNQT